MGRPQARSGLVQIYSLLVPWPQRLVPGWARDLSQPKESQPGTFSRKGWARGRRLVVILAAAWGWSAPEES